MDPGQCGGGVALSSGCIMLTASPGSREKLSLWGNAERGQESQRHRDSRQVQRLVRRERIQMREGDSERASENLKISVK